MIYTFTTKFKVTLGIVAAAVVAGGLGANQVVLQKQVSNLQNEPKVNMVRTVVVTPTATPSATPTASLRYVLPTKSAVVTKTPSPVK